MPNVNGPSEDALDDYTRRHHLFKDWLARTQTAWESRIPPIPRIRPEQWYFKRPRV